MHIVSTDMLRLIHSGFSLFFQIVTIFYFVFFIICYVFIILYIPFSALKSLLK